MAAITAMITAATAAVGLGMQVYGMSAQASAVKKQQSAMSAQTASINAAAEAQQKAEDARRKQMELDAARRKRQMIREQIQARSFALASTTAQGASAPGSSALPGALAGISGQTGVNMLGVDQNLEIGRNIFDANAESSGFYRQAALFGGQAATAQGQASTAAGWSSLGGAILSSAPTIGRVGGYAFSSGFGSQASNIEPMTGRRIGGGI